MSSMSSRPKTNLPDFGSGERPAHLRLSAQDRLLDELSYRIDLQTRREPMRNGADEAGKHAGLEVGRADHACPDCAGFRVWLVQVAELLCQAFVEGEDGGL